MSIFVSEYLISHNINELRETEWVREREREWDGFVFVCALHLYTSTAVLDGQAGNVFLRFHNGGLCHNRYKHVHRYPFTLVSLRLFQDFIVSMNKHDGAMDTSAAPLSLPTSLPPYSRSAHMFHTYVDFNDRNFANYCLQIHCRWLHKHKCRACSRHTNTQRAFTIYRTHKRPFINRIYWSYHRWS